VEEAVERLRKPEDGTKREIGKSCTKWTPPVTPRRGKKPHGRTALKGSARKEGENTPKRAGRTRE